MTSPWSWLPGVQRIIRLRRREKFDGFGRVPPPDPAHAGQFAALQDADYDLVLRAEALVNHRHVTWPSASLLVSRGQAELRVSGVEPIRIARAEVTGLRWVRYPFGRGRRETAGGAQLVLKTVDHCRAALRRHAVSGSEPRG